MSPATRQETLLQRMDTLIKREDALAKHLRGQDGRHEAASDRVAYIEMDEVIEGLDDAVRAELVQIQHALKRIDAGDGDDCEACGEPVGAGRLDAVPTATRCVSCAS